LREHVRPAAVVHHLGRQQAEARVVVFGVVPGEEGAAEGACVLDAAEAVGKLRPVLERLELALGEGVVVGDVRAAVRLGDAEVRQQQGDWSARHRRAAVGVHRHHPWPNRLLLAGLVDELLCELRGLTLGHHPPDDVAAEDVEDHVQVEVGPLHRPE